MNQALQNNLAGMNIPNGWTIDKAVTRSNCATGAQFSTGFIATHEDGRRAFLKVLDPAVDPSLEPNEQLKELERRLAVFNYECDLLDKCVIKKIRRVVRIIDRGICEVDKQTGPIHYIMFELAERDLSEHASLTDTLNTQLNMHIVHQTSLALEQLHFHQIRHQDIKPSNVLLFLNMRIKLGDLGHAHDKASPRPGHNGKIAGDPGYAPPEQLYGYNMPDTNSQRVATDLYLLGGLIVYLFTNLSLTSLISNQLSPQHHWEAWPDNFENVKPYLREAWDAAIEDFASAVPEDIRDELVTLTRYLTDPSPERRGHPRNRQGKSNTYGLQRFSSRFHVLAKQCELISRSKTSERR